MSAATATKPAPPATTTAAANPPAQQQLFRGVVKQVTSADCVVIRSLTVKDGKNLEKTVMLANINAPRLGRRINPTSPDSVVEPDQPYAFEAREFLRKRVLGKEVCFVKEATTTNNLDRGQLYLGRDTVSGENVADALISAGLVEVRRTNKGSEEESRLIALEEHAKNQGVGKWSKDSEADHVRNIKYTVDNPKHFVDSFHQKPVDAIVEYVRDGSTIRLLLVPSYHVVTVQLSGIRCPGFKREGDNEVAEPFAEEARQYVETRLLQQDVKVVLEGVANQSNGILQGTILHPRGNISEFLLRDGLAKCVDWSMGIVSVGPEKYRNAERQAKQAKLKLWKNYTQTSSGFDEANKNFTGKVVEVFNGDGMVVKLQDGTFKRIFLSSIRPPRSADFPDLVAKADKKGNPLYDVPYLFEAREFLRKKLIGKRVNCTIDYVQPKSNDYPEKVCCTVMINDLNVAEAIVSNGLAKVIRYKQDDDQRSSKYDDLLAAESRAQKKAVGLHSNKEPATIKVADVSADVSRAKQFLPLLQRAGKMDALVEFVSSGSRFKLYIPKETCIITFLLTGIDCPRLGRPAMNNNPAQPSEEYAEEAFLLSKSLTLQREVKVEVEGVDKGGNFLGQMTTDDGVSVTLSLVEAGYAAVYRSGSVNPATVAALVNAEQKAKEKRLNRWKNYVEEVVVPKEEQEKSEPQERVVSQKKIVVTEVTNDLHFYGQLVENGPKLEQLTTQLRAQLESSPPVAGAYTPKVGDVCVAKFSLDDEWYRAKVLSVQGSNVTVLFIDYGNKETTQPIKLAQLPAGFDSLPPQAQEYALALVQLSSDEDDNEIALERFKELAASDPEATFAINVEYKSNNVDYVTLTDSKKVDIGKTLIAEGYTSVDRSHKERRLHKLFTDYLKSLAQAKQAHKNMWRYGDKEQDDAAEFGVSRR